MTKNTVKAASDEAHSKTPGRYSNTLRTTVAPVSEVSNRWA